jgi:hypothetical protein
LSFAGIEPATSASGSLLDAGVCRPIPLVLLRKPIGTRAHGGVGIRSRLGSSRTARRVVRCENDQRKQRKHQEQRAAPEYGHAHTRVVSPARGASPRKDLRRSCSGKA